MKDLTQRLPVELLAEILGHASAQDILRFMQVNRVFRDVILSSPLIQHKLNLHAVGLEHNPAAGIDLAESRKALFQYLTNFKTLSPIEERTVDNLRIPNDIRDTEAAGGVYAIVMDQVRLFTLGSASRGIPYKEWTIPLPVTEPESYGFYPGADIIAFIKVSRWTNVEINIHLRTLSSGGLHPVARCPEISYSRTGVDVYDIPCVSISGSRLVLLISVRDGMHIIIWDWKSAQLLFSLEDNRYESVEFIDDYRFFVSLGSLGDNLPCVVLVDTEKDVGGVPAQTTFQLSPCFRDSECLDLVLERGMHEPSPAERLAPFHQDPTQRIATLLMSGPSCCLVFPVEALVRLSEGHEGCMIEWDEWKKHVVIPIISRPDLYGVWVTGCRLLHITSEGIDTDAEVEVYDFSKKGRVEYLSERSNPGLDGVGYLLSTGGNARLPWDLVESIDINGGHDSIAFFYIPDDLVEDDPGALQCTLLIWTF